MVNIYVGVHVSNHVQVLMLNKSIGTDFYILMHKRNVQRDTWYHLTTEWTADHFQKNFPRYKNTGRHL